MSKRNNKIRERTPALHVVCVTALVLQWLYGGVMTLIFYPLGWLYGLLAGIALLTAFSWFVGKDTRGGRVTCRVLTGAAYAFSALPLVAALLEWLIYGQVGAELLVQVGAMPLPALFWLGPAVGYMALSRGRYDRFVVCFTQLWALASLLLLQYMDGNPHDVNWALTGNAAYTAILMGVTVFATVAVWLCALIRPREKTPVSLEGTTLQLDE